MQSPYQTMHSSPACLRESNGVVDVSPDIYLWRQVEYKKDYMYDDEYDLLKRRNGC